MMRTAAVIPARMESTRLRQKLLADLDGRPILWHVWNNARSAASIDEVCVATDSPKVAEMVGQWGGAARVAQGDYRTGSDRVASVLEHLAADIIVNVQGDEPLTTPHMLDEVVACASDGRFDVVTPVFRIREMADLNDPNLVKVVRTREGRAMYFSRSAIPYVRDCNSTEWTQRCTFWGHIGVYAFQRNVIARYPQLPTSELEAAERLEQLRLLDAQYWIQTLEVSAVRGAIDSPEDLERVRRMIAKRQ